MLLRHRSCKKIIKVWSNMSRTCTIAWENGNPIRFLGSHGSITKNLGIVAHGKIIRHNTLKLNFES